MQVIILILKVNQNFQNERVDSTDKKDGAKPAKYGVVNYTFNNERRESRLY